MPYRDSGVFSYIGSRILAGDIPYLDIWDHKPPIIFYINALGLWLGNGSFWGIWAIEFVSLFTAAYIGFLLLKESFGTTSALLATFIWLSTLTLTIQNGNLTTEYTLPLQFAAFSSVRAILKSKISSATLVFAGIGGGLAFLTKQTAIGTWLAIFLFLLFDAAFKKRRQVRLVQLSIFSVSFLTMPFLSWVFFWAQGAHDYYLDAAFRYNFFYSTDLRSLGQRVKPIFEAVNLLAPTSILTLAVIGYGLGIASVIYPQSKLNKSRDLLIVSLIAFPIEFILISTSGRTYPHYYMTILPVLSIFSACVLHIIFIQVRSWKMTNSIYLTVSLAILFMPLWGAGWNYSSLLRYSPTHRQAVAKYVSSVTNTEDYVLMWGGEAVINFLSQRRSPSRFVYQFALYQEDYTSEAMILAFMHDIIDKEPHIIIDTGHPLTPLLEFPIETAETRKYIARIKNQYKVVETIGDWTVYTYRGND